MPRRETAFAFAALGATVILGCRNIDVAKEVAQEIRSVCIDSLKTQSRWHMLVPLTQVHACKATDTGSESERPWTARPCQALEHT